MKRYYVVHSGGLPISNQPNNGYTYLQVIERVQREIEVLDNNFDIVNDAKQAF